MNHSTVHVSPRSPRSTRAAAGCTWVAPPRGGRHRAAVGPWPAAPCYRWALGPSFGLRDRSKHRRRPVAHRPERNPGAMMALVRVLGVAAGLLVLVAPARSTSSTSEASTGKCAVSTAAFTHAINGTQCLNLTQVAGVSTADMCQCACAESFGCATWLFGSQTSQCWIGSVPCDGGHQSSWAGASKLPVGAKPPACKGPGPLAHIVEGIGCSGLQPEKELQSPAECEAACCGSETCLTWVFDSAGGLQGVKCWMGNSPCSQGAASPAWSGSSKVPVTVAPHPPAPPPPPLPPLPPFSIPRLSPRPTRVTGAPEPLVSLNGEWSFKPNKTAAAWSKILVPSEYTLQGYRVPAGTPVVYQRQFIAPARPATSRLKLRSDGCYSQCNVSVNGKSVGSHLGGFTPFGELALCVYVFSSLTHCSCSKHK